MKKQTGNCHAGRFPQDKLKRYRGEHGPRRQSALTPGLGLARNLRYSGATTFSGLSLSYRDYLANKNINNDKRGRA